MKPVVSTLFTDRIFASVQCIAYMYLFVCPSVSVHEGPLSLILHVLVIYTYSINIDLCDLNLGHVMSNGARRTQWFSENLFLITLITIGTPFLINLIAKNGMREVAAFLISRDY